MSDKPAEKPYKPRIVEVFGKNVFSGPLLSTDDACTIVIRRTTGQPMAFFTKLADDAWAFANEGDKDWADSKARFGVS